MTNWNCFGDFYSMNQHMFWQGANIISCLCSLDNHCNTLSAELQNLQIFQFSPTCMHSCVQSCDARAAAGAERGIPINFYTSPEPQHSRAIVTSLCIHTDGDAAPCDTVQHNKVWRVPTISQMSGLDYTSAWEGHTFVLVVTVLSLSLILAVPTGTIFSPVISMLTPSLLFGR